MKMRGIGPGDPTSWRQALGETIRTFRDHRGKTTREVARRTRAALTDVEAWEAGTLVPTSEQWKALCEGVNRALRGYTEMYNHARAEHREAQELITRSIEMHGSNGANGRTTNPKPLTASLGDKIANALVPSSTIRTADRPPQPTLTQPQTVGDARTVDPGQPVTYVATEPRVPMRPGSARAQLGLADDDSKAKDGRRLPPPTPPNSKTREAIEERKRYVRGVLLQRPHIALNSPDGILALLRQRFGIGLDPSVIQAIRTEVLAGTAPPLEPSPPTREDPKATPFNAPELFRAPATEPTQMVGLDQLTPTTRPALPQPTGEVNEQTINEAVALILSEIPNLESFSVRVDDNGETHVDYQVKEVKITTRGGSFKVKR